MATLAEREDVRAVQVEEVEEDAPGEGAAPAAGDAVRTMVANAFQGAIASASSNNNGVAEAANVEGEGGAAEGQQQHQIRVTRDMHQALFLVNNLLVGMPDDNPSFLMQMNPDSFEEDLYAAIEARHPEQVNSVPVGQFARVLAPLCRQLHEVAAASRQSGAAGAGGAQPSGVAAAGASGSRAGAAAAGAGASDGESGSGSGALTRPRLPARPPRSASAAGAASAAVARTNSTETWTDLCGPNDAEDVQEYRKSLQQLREDLCRMYLKIGSPLSTLHLRQTLHRLKVSEMQVAPFSPSRPNMDEKAKAGAQEREQQGEPLTSRLVVAVIGLSGAGKTSLINRLLDLPPIDPFEGGTKKCRVVDGEARGIPVRFIDSPGLELGFHAQQTNRFKMIGLKRMCAKKGNRPHVYLYVDRMDTARKQETDIALLTSVYAVLGRERLYSTIGVLTYASTKPPDSKTGPLEYEAWSTPRTRSLQFAMMATANDRTAQYIIAPAENHPRCRVAAEGEPVLPSGVRWMSNLLGIMSMFMGLSSATELPKPKSLTKKAAGPSTSSMDIRRLFSGGGEKQVPVTYILQQYNQPKAVHKLPDEERAILSAGEIARMKESKHELAREEQRKRREYMKMREDEARSPEPIVPTLAPDPPLPPVFDALQDTYRYRYNENQAGWIVRPFVDSNGPDRSDGINGGQAERHGILRLPNHYIGGAPSRLLFQSVKDKDSMVLVCNAETSASIGRDNVVTASLESQTLSGDAIYTLRVEPRVKYGTIGGRKRFKTAIGLLNTRIGEEFNPSKGPVAKGIRLEQRVRLTDGLKVVGSHVGMMGGTSSMRERGRAFGVEATFKPKGSIEGRELMVGWNTMRTQRLALSGRDLGGQQVNGGTLAMVQHLSPETVLNARMQMSGSGQSTLSVRITSHDKMAMRWAYLMPVIGWLLDKLTKRSNEPEDF